MNLRNPFPSRVREIWQDKRVCSNCGSNMILELHHIKGRESSSALNSYLICRFCHTNKIHLTKDFLNYTLRFLLSNRYIFTNKDKDFLDKYKNLYDQEIYKQAKNQ